MTEQFDAVDVIRTKRDGGALSPGQIAWVLDAYTRRKIAMARALICSSATTPRV